MQTRKGQTIEDESMQIIENEIGPHSYNEQEWPIVRRVIPVSYTHLTLPTNREV